MPITIISGSTDAPQSSPGAPGLPHLLSSSDSGTSGMQRRLGNTGVQRKSNASHNAIVEATRTSGEMMAMQMKQMAEASRDLERSKIDVQLKVFTEQMDYQREKDRRLYENSRIAQENARLAIMKQGEIVGYLAKLSSVLSQGLLVSTAVEGPELPPSTSGYNTGAMPNIAATPNPPQ
jgi:hypothetical protein